MTADYQHRPELELTYGPHRLTNTAMQPLAPVDPHAEKIAEGFRRTIERQAGQIAMLTARVMSLEAEVEIQRRAKRVAEGCAAEWQSKCERMEATMKRHGLPATSPTPQ